MNLNGAGTCAYCDTSGVDGSYWEDGTKPDDFFMCEVCVELDMPRNRALSARMVVTLPDLSKAVRAILEHLEEALAKSGS